MGPATGKAPVFDGRAAQHVHAHRAPAQLRHEPGEQLQLVRTAGYPGGVPTADGSAAVRVAAALGADHAIDFSAGDHVPRIWVVGGADVVLDTVGGNTFARSPDVLADRGRVVSIADTIEPQNLLAEWGVIATYHFLFVSPAG